MKTPVYLLAGILSALSPAASALADPGDGDVCKTPRCQCEEKKGGDWVNGRCIIPVPTQSYGTLNFKIMTAAYAPPGVGSTVSYGTTSELGTLTQTVIGSTKTFSIDARSAFGNGSYNGTTGEKTGYSTEKTTIFGDGFTALSTEDQSSHWNDLVWLWMREPVYGTGGPKMTVYNDGRGNRSSRIHPAPGENAEFVSFTIGELAGVFPAGGKNATLDLLSDHERYTLMMLNPWFAATQYGQIGSIDDYLDLEAFHPERFEYTGKDVQLNGPGYPGAPSVYRDFSLVFNTEGRRIQGNTSSSSETYLLSLVVNFFVEIGVELSATVEHYLENVTESIQGAQKLASASVGTTTLCFHQRFAVFYDAAFGTYAFSARDAGSADCAALPIVFGQIVDEGGNPAMGKQVELVFPDGSAVLTTTDENGVYRVYDAESQPSEVRPEEKSLRAIQLPREQSSMAASF